MPFDLSQLLPQINLGEFVPLLLWPFFAPALVLASIATGIAWLILP